jgi:hypothetical protein
MTTFEKELRKIFEQNTWLTGTKFVGRSCYAQLSENIRVRVDFIKLGYADKYEALKVSLINRTEGVIDSTVLRFADVLGKKQVDNPNFPDGVIPYLWNYQGRLDWYVYQPTTADYRKLTDEVNSYMEVFYEPNQEMSAGMVQQMG